MSESNTPIARRTWKGRRAGYLLVGLATASAAIAVYVVSAAPAAPGQRLTSSAPVHATQRMNRADAPPGPAEFASDVAGTTKAYAGAHGDVARITNVDCVEASSGRYMCSYAVARPHRVGECHLMQATWTPSRASTYTVTLAGRVHKCGSLHEALGSLR